MPRAATARVLTSILCGMLAGHAHAVSAGADLTQAPLALDPNLPSSPFSGVVALDISWAGHGTGLCTGALIGARHVLTAAHCVDPTDTGTPLALDAGDTVNVVFNAGPAPIRVAAAGLALHPDFRGFDTCPDGSSGCFNDDLAVITLAADAPGAARVYRLWGGPWADPQRLTLAGYGATGDGRRGFTLDGTLTDKRVGENLAEHFELDDEQDFVTGPREVWFADFDGVDRFGTTVDTLCEMGVACGPALPEGVEAMVGHGDSGGPAFMRLASGEYLVAGTSSFAGSFFNQRPGGFGNYFGGTVAGAYASFLRTATGGAAAVVVPEPGTWALAGLGLAMLAAARRRVTSR